LHEQEGIIIQVTEKGNVGSVGSFSCRKKCVENVGSLNTPVVIILFQEFMTEEKLARHEHKKSTKDDVKQVPRS
jgi:hypothetical protein